MKQIFTFMLLLGLMNAQAQLTDCKFFVADCLQVPIAPTSVACQSGKDAANLVIKEWSSTGCATLPSYRIIVTSPEQVLLDGAGKPRVDANGNELKGEPVVGVYADGSFDFTNNPDTGSPFVLQDYKFTVFAYRESQVDSFVNNNKALLEFLVGTEITSTDLAVLFDAMASLFGDLSIKDVENALCKPITNLGGLTLEDAGVVPVPEYNYGGSYVVSLKAEPDCLSTGVSSLPDNTLIITYQAQDNAVQVATIGKAQINLHDLTGKNIFATQVSPGKTQVNLPSLVNGMYILNAQSTDGRMLTQRIIVQ